MLTILVFSFGFGGPVRFTGDPWFGADKLKHFFTAAAVQTLGYGGLRAVGMSHAPALGGAWVLSAGASIGKEVHDARGYGLFSLKDLTWDAAGAGTAAILVGHASR